MCVQPPDGLWPRIFGVGRPYSKSSGCEYGRRRRCRPLLDGVATPTGNANGGVAPASPSADASGRAELRLATRESQVGGTDSLPITWPSAVDASTGAVSTGPAARTISAPPLAVEATPTGAVTAPPSAPIIKGSGLLAALVAAIALNPAALTSTLAMLVGSMPRIVDMPSPVETLAAPDPAAGAPLDAGRAPPDDACTAGRGGWFGGRCTVLGVAGPA